VKKFAKWCESLHVNQMFWLWPGVHNGTQTQTQFFVQFFSYNFLLVRAIFACFYAIRVGKHEWQV